MTLQDEVTLLDPFTHTKQDRKKIENFEFIEGEKVRIDETFCTLGKGFNSPWQNSGIVHKE